MNVLLALFAFAAAVASANATTTWVAVGTDGLVFSRDGNTWTRSAQVFGCGMTSVRFRNGLWIASGPRCPFSFATAKLGNEAGNWTLETDPLLSSGVTDFAVASVGGVETMVVTLVMNSSAPFGQRPAIATKVGVSREWKVTADYNAISPGGGGMTAVYFANGLFLAAGYNGGFQTTNSLLWSRDGLTWTGLPKKDSGVLPVWTMAYSESLDRWVLAGSQVFVSSNPTNASSWTTIPNPLWPYKVDIYLGTVLWNAEESMFLLVGGRGGLIGPGLNQLATSPDGLTWRVLEDRPFSCPTTVLYVRAASYSVASKRFLVGGQGIGSQFASSLTAGNHTFALVPDAAPFKYNRALSEFYTGPNAIASADSDG